MKRSLPAFAVFIVSAAQAQSWCPPGAEWLYGFSSQQATGVRHAWYAGDTVVGGMVAKRIEQDIHAFQSVFPFTSGFYTTAQPLFTVETDDRVMLWDNSSSSYDTLMWFGAEPGDHWDAPHYPAPARFDVLDTGTKFVNGIPLRYLVVEEPILMGLTDTLIERIGFDYFYINPNESFVIDFTTTWLQCYHDTDIAEYDGTMQQYPCDFTLAVPEAPAASLSLYPNPGGDQLWIKLPPGAHRITLCDATGRDVLEQAATTERTLVDTSRLPNGIYLVRVDTHVLLERWVKQ